MLLFLNLIPQLRPPIIMAIERDVLQGNNRFYSCDTFNSSYCVAVDRGWISLPRNVQSAQVRLYFVAFARPCLLGNVCQVTTRQTWPLIGTE